MRKKRILIVLILAALAGGGYYYYKTKYILNEETPLILYGNVDIRDVALGFRVSGRIDTLYFEEGDTVQKGDLLAVMDKEPFEAETAMSEAQVHEADVLLKNAQAVMERREKLIDNGAVSIEEYSNQVAKRDEAEAKLQVTKAALRESQIRLKDTDLFAPDAGIILTRVHEPGSIVSAGQTVYTLALTDPVWVRTYIDEPNLGHIYPGMKAVVHTDSGGEYDGQIGFISPQAEFTPKEVQTTQLRTDLVYRLRVIVRNPDRGLRQGMPVTIELQEASE